MAGDPLRKVTAGDPFKMSAATYNKFIDAVKATEQAGGNSSMGLNTVGNIVLVRNDSGADVGLYNVLGVGSLVISPSGSTGQLQQNIVIACTTPTGGSKGNFVITADPIANGSIGRAFADGLFPVQVNVASGGGNFADVSSGNTTQLASSASGSARIMTRQGGVGVQWALCRMATAAGSSASELPAVSTGAILYSTGTVWAALPAGDAGETIQYAGNVPVTKHLELT